MSESSEYSRLRKERKAKADETVLANAKAATAAKAKAQGKLSAKADKAFAEALTEKSAKREGWRRATDLPTRDELEAVAEGTPEKVEE